MSKKILIVEDEEILLNTLSDQCRADGFEVVQAKDGEAALELAMKERPDLILLDLLLPKMHGMKVLEKLRKGDEWGKHVPVIILTNVADSNMVAKGMEAGLDGSYEYLVKTDWSLADIMKKIRDKLGV